MAEAARFKVYPRGFLGVLSKTQDVRSESPMRETLVSSIQDYAHKEKDKGTGKITPHPGVSSMYSDVVKRSPNILTFEFDEFVYRNALSAFGTSDFEAWVDLQFESNMTGRNHHAFIEDMVRYITTGRMNASFITWNAILRISDEGDPIGHPSKLIQQYFSIRGHQYSVVDLIARYCQRPDGVNHLIETLNTLFGPI